MLCFSMKRHILGAWLVAGLVGQFTVALHAQSVDSNNIVVVVKRGNDVEALRLEQVSRIFLGLNDTLPNGVIVIPVDAPEGSALHQDFYSKVTGKTVAQIKAHRARQSFTGVGIPPRQAATPAQAFKLDSKEKPVITYIRKRDLDDQHQVVLEVTK